LVYRNHKLKKEFSERKKLNRDVYGILATSSERWFDGKKLEYSNSLPNIALLHFRIVRDILACRCIFSPLDALFCAKFFEVVKSLKTPGFHFNYYHSKIGVAGMFRAVALFTELEAKNFGIFFMSRSNFYMERK